MLLTSVQIKQDMPKGAEKPKPRKAVALLEDMADATVLKPTTDFGARQEHAKQLMSQAQHKSSQKKFGESADLYGRAEELYLSLNDTVGAEEAASKRQTAVYQAQMDTRACDAKLKNVRISINQGLHAMQKRDDQAALMHFSSAEQMLQGMRDADQQVLQEIRKHKVEAEERIKCQAHAQLSALQNVEQQQDDIARMREQQLRQREVSLRAHEVEARKHEMAARCIADANEQRPRAPSPPPAAGGSVGGGGRAG